MMSGPPGFNPMMNLAMLNPQMQFQQMMMQQQMQQHMQRSNNANTNTTNSGNMTNPANQSTIPPESQKPPVGYVCFKCRQPGHWIYYCPNVPKGQFVPRPGMNGSQSVQQEETPSLKEKPSELTCRICENLMKDAVLVPCCGKSFCKECITTELDETNRCPVCNKEGVLSSAVIPNRSLRNTIQAYKEQQQNKEAEMAAAAAAAAATAELNETTETNNNSMLDEGMNDNNPIKSESNENEMQVDSLSQQEQHVSSFPITTLNDNQQVSHS
ncbi:hypothetical protein BDC45DRAFT_101269 [Circinella umbellata]|nr:hypothetical protein BDC45DRAFT_101269 [Circinella umbellata]